MARTRSIKPGFFINEELAELPCEARLLFIGLWTIADREGRLEDRPRKIKAAIFPYDDCDVDGLLGLLEGKGFLNRYQVREQGYIEIRNFIKHQKPHPKETPSEVPAPRDETRVSARHAVSAGHAGSAGHAESATHAGSAGHAESATHAGSPQEESARQGESTNGGSASCDDDDDDDGAGRERERTGREKVGAGREKIRMSREIKEAERNQVQSGREKERPGPVIPGLSKDRRIEGQEEWEGGEPEAESTGKPGKTAGRGGGIEKEPGVRAVFEYWRGRTGHSDAKLTREREMKIRGRLEEGYTVEQLKEAVEGCRGSPFHQGDNERGHRYDDITLICRSGSKVEQFIEMTKGNGNERNQSIKRSNVKKIIEGLELVRARAAQSGDPGDDNQQGEGGMLAAGIRTG